MESAENQPQPNLERKLTGNTNPPRSKMETIALLNASIDRLEETIRRISEDSVEIPPTDSMDNLLTTAQELEDAVTAIEAKIATPTIPEAEVIEPIIAEPIPPKPIQPSASATTAKPTPPSSEKIASKPKKKNALIISAVTAIAIAIGILFWLQPEFIANILPQESAPQVAVTLDEATEKLVEQPLNPLQDEAIADSDADLGIVRDISAMDFPEEIESVAEPIEDVVETVIPSELASPDKPKNLKMVAIKPQLNFTPEQNLVAMLETKISALTQAQESKFIQNVQVNPDRSLLVRVTDDWYELDEAEQNDIGNEILQRSRSYSFERLELKDNEDSLVARSPIIGNNIILQGTSDVN